MRKFTALSTVLLFCAAATVVHADAFRVRDNSGWQIDNWVSNTDIVDIAGDGAFGNWFAVVNTDGSLTRYDGNQTAVATVSGSYIGIASQARANDFADFYWGIRDHGVDTVRISNNSVTTLFTDTNVTYTAGAGDLYRGHAILARADGGIDVIDRDNQTRDVTQALSGETFLDVSGMGSWNNNFYGLTDDALYRLQYSGGTVSIAATLATFTAGTYTHVAGDSRSNEVAYLARANGGVDEYNNSTGLTNIISASEGTFTSMGMYAGGGGVGGEFGNYFYVATIPEPGSLLLLGAGAAMLVSRRRQTA